MLRLFGGAGSRYKFNCGQPSGICQHQIGAFERECNYRKSGVLFLSPAMVIVLVIAVRSCFVIILIAVREQGLFPRYCTAAMRTAPAESPSSCPSGSQARRTPPLALRCFSLPDALMVQVKLKFDRVQTNLIL